VTVIGALADLLVGIGPDHASPELLRSARRCLLDALGCVIHGTSLAEGRVVLRAVRALSAGSDSAFRCADAAALAGGSLCHLRELDDVHYAILHPGAVCVPAALAAADRLDLPLGRVLWALIVGYEAMARVAKGQNYLNHRKRGWHGTATCGAFGAAAAVGRLLQLDRTHLAWALGLAGSRTGGTWAFAADGAMSKRLHPGLAARDGLTAAYLAQHGVSGPMQILEAEDGGFYRTTSDGWDLTEVTRAWGEEWAIRETEFKWYAACKSAHAPIEAGLRVYRKAQGACLASGIERVQVTVNSTGMAMAGRGYRPDNVTSAQLSIPYAIAVALTGGDGTVADYTPEQVGRPDRMTIAQKVTVSSSADMDVLRTTRHKVPGEIQVGFGDGTVLREYVEDPKGSRENPLSDVELGGKFRRLAGDVIGTESANRIVDLVMEGAQSTPIHDLIATLHRAEGSADRRSGLRIREEC
jgi:2-methylcitrate dehydratase PrpD